jgi:hypothetical protein
MMINYPFLLSVLPDCGPVLARPDQHFPSSTPLTVVPAGVRPEILVRGVQEVAGGRRLSLQAFRTGGTHRVARNHTAENALATITERERPIVN